MRPWNQPLARASAVAAVLALSVSTSVGTAAAGSTPELAAAGPVVMATADEYTFDGHGWGHGRGMGQYGALGYAVDHGWTWTKILNHFYGGTTLGDAGNPEMTVELEGLNGDQLVVIGTSIVVNGTAIGGTSARLTANADGTVKVERGTSCTGPWTAVSGTFKVGSTSVTTPNGSAANAPLTDLIRVCEGTGQRAYRGSLSVVRYKSAQMTINKLPTESYLRGVVPRESPASWGSLGGGKGMNALKAQAVAARSYALSSTRSSGAKTCDTTSCQVYSGAGWRPNSGAIESLEATNTDTAIAETAGKVRKTSSGAIARTEFSSSTGGYSAGGTFPAVVDNGDDISSNPNHDWNTTLTAATIASRLGIPGPIRSVRVTERNGHGDWGGRVEEVVVVDANGKSRSYSGSAFRTAMGTSTFKSDWFTIDGISRVEAENVVRALYEDVLGRGVDASGLQTWTDYVVRTGDTAGLVRQIATSRERMNNLVAAQYRLALHREPEPGGLATWVAHLEAGHGVYDLQVGIYSSPEALATLGGGNVTTWVGALYEAVLGRAAGASEKQFWVGIAESRGRRAVVEGIARSDEATLRRLTVYYETFLLRGVDASGRATFLPLMTGRGDFTIPVSLGSSPEYWARAQTRSF